MVRERITELDLVVETVVPASSNSRTFTDKSYPYYIGDEASKDVIPMMVIIEGGAEKVLVGVDDVFGYLTDVFGTRAPIVDENEEELKKQVVDALVSAGEFLPDVLRSGRGNAVAYCALSADTPRPTKPLVLYSYEGNQFCRLVREVLTELDIPYELQSAGKGSSRRKELAEITGGSTQCPYMIDPNSDVKMSDSKEIIQYLYKSYANFTPPSEILGAVSKVVTPVLKPIYEKLAPLQAGSSREDSAEYTSEIQSAKDGITKEIQADDVVIYTYSLSPFCTEAIGVLDNLDVQYKEISLGLEWVPFLINEGGPQKRAALGEMTGQTSLPHIFVRGESIGGLYEGLLPSLESGAFFEKLEKQRPSSSKMVLEEGSFE